MPGWAEFKALCRGRTGTIKGLLLNQSFAAGVGNWIADEILYQARIAPMRSVKDLAPDELKRVRSRVESIIRKAVEVQSVSERFPRNWLFHDRWGKSRDARTSRGEEIVFSTVAGRTTAWVPSAQR